MVDAADAGDFSRRVEAEFPDRELNELAALDQQSGRDGRSRAGRDRARCCRRWPRPTSRSASTGDYQGAFAQLKTDTNAVAEKLSEIVGQLQRDLAAASRPRRAKSSSGANDLSERTTKQAATIEETSAAMEQLAATVLQNAQRAKDGQRRGRGASPAPPKRAAR